MTTRTGKKRREFPSHAPIIIGGGGSVLLDFNHNHFVSTPGDPDWFKNDDDEIVHLGIDDNTPGGDPPKEIPTPGPDCKIVIECKRSNGSDVKLVEITGKPFGVRFDRATFRAVGNSNRYHRAASHEISGILQVLDANGSPHGRGVPIPAGGLCSIRAEDL